jgi:hypothetical protein
VPDIALFALSAAILREKELPAEVVGRLHLTGGINGAEAVTAEGEKGSAAKLLLSPKRSAAADPARCDLLDLNNSITVRMMCSKARCCSFPGCESNDTHALAAQDVGPSVGGGSDGGGQRERWLPRAGKSSLTLEGNCPCCALVDVTCSHIVLVHADVCDCACVCVCCVYEHVCMLIHYCLYVCVCFRMPLGEVGCM